MELIRVKKEVDANDFNEDDIDIEENEVAFGKCEDTRNEAFQYTKNETSKSPAANEEKYAFHLNTEKDHLKLIQKLSTDETRDKEQVKIENSIDLFDEVSEVLDRRSDNEVHFTKTEDFRYRKNGISKSPDDNVEKFTFQLNIGKDHKISQKLSRNVICDKEQIKIENSIDRSHSNNDVDFTKTKESLCVNKEHTKYVADSTDHQVSTSSLCLETRDAAVSKQKYIVKKNTPSDKNLSPSKKDDRKKQVCTPIDRGHLKRNCRSIFAVENRFSKDNLIILLEKIDEKKMLYYKISKSFNPNRNPNAHEEKNDDKRPRCEIRSKLFNGRSKQCISGRKTRRRICPKAFNCDHCMKIHNSTSFDCKLCAKSFLSKAGLKIHEELHQRDMDKCKICSKTFPSMDFLRNHEMIHTGEKPYQCQVCFVYFTSTSNLRVHEAIHTEEKTFNCKICSKSFALKGNLRTHQKIHIGKKHRCNICSRLFGCADNLKNHLVVHTGEKPYRCKICSKYFSHRGSLKGHERIHTGERPYHCKFCTFKFKHRSHLTIHERIHTGERPFKCKICGKAFYKGGHLRSHEKTHEKTQKKLFHCEFCRKSFTQERWLKSHEKTHK